MELPPIRVGGDPVHIALADEAVDPIGGVALGDARETGKLGDGGPLHGLYALETEYLQRRQILALLPDRDKHLPQKSQPHPQHDSGQ